MSTDYSTRVAAEVRAAFARAGKDRGDLAEVIGVSRPTATARWQGTQPYTLDELATIADSLGVDIATIVTPQLRPQPAPTAA